MSHKRHFFQITSFLEHFPENLTRMTKKQNPSAIF